MVYGIITFVPPAGTWPSDGVRSETMIFFQKSKFLRSARPAEAATNFERPFTPRTSLRSPRNFGNARFRRFANFDFLTSKIFFRKKIGFFFRKNNRRQKIKICKSSETHVAQISRRSERSSKGKRTFEVRFDRFDNSFGSIDNFNCPAYLGGPLC